MAQKGETAALSDKINELGRAGKYAEAVGPATGTNLGVAASDFHLGKDASETKLKRTPLADYGIVYFATHGLVIPACLNDASSPRNACPAFWAPFELMARVARADYFSMLRCSNRKSAPRSGGWSRNHHRKRIKMQCSKCLIQIGVLVGINQIVRDRLGKLGVHQY